MKRFIGGCLLVVALVAAGVAGASYLAYRSAGALFRSARDAATGATDLARASERLQRRDAYTPPANGELTQAQVDRFLAVQARVREALDSRWAELQTKSEALRKRATEPSHDVSVSDVLGLLSDMTGIYTNARRVQIDGLNIQKFSADEYSWVRLRVYEAAGLTLAGSLDLSALEKIVREGEARTGLQMPEMPAPNVPPRNLELVAPHVGKLREWLPIAMMGL